MFHGRNMSKTIVIHHSADFDGLFCREIARKFLPPDTEFIGWDYGNPKICLDGVTGPVYILDLSPECLHFHPNEKLRTVQDNIIWIDHHKSAIEQWSSSITGYRIDGVAACRLAWQWFAQMGSTMLGMPPKEAFINRAVTEPLAVRLAGEYDIWDKRDTRTDVFQFGLRSVDVGADFWEALLRTDDVGEKAVSELLANGHLLQRFQQGNDAGIMGRSFMVEFEGLKFLALNIPRCNSLTFTSKDIPETGHDALMGFYWDGKAWKVSLYHARHNTGIDLSLIAVKYKGGGHRGACGFQVGNLPGVSELPFISS